MVGQILVSGLAIGSIYALVAMGYYITFETTNILNFSQGEFLMMGSLIGFSLFVSTGLPFPAAILLAVVVLAVMGILLERLAIRPLKHFQAVGWIMSTVGVGIMLKNFAVLTWGGGERFFPSVFGDKVVRIAGVGILPQEAFNFVSAMLTMVVILVFLKKSLLGKALRAVAFNKDAAGLMGINVQRMVTLSFLLSSAMAGLGGILVAPVTYASPHMGTLLGLKAFAAAIIGGLRNPTGILFGGLLLGVVELIFASWSATWREASSFLLIILVLSLKPEGLFSRPSEEKF
ncbi:MAG: branched-chain amino acid ABC transporter permease [Actinobacteria bacterium]|nr:branched-chain amino acid ABC transporter permease [Actinomycetota bacterium]